MQQLQSIAPRVEGLLRQTALAELLPRLGRLRADEIHDKGDSDLVTDADLAAERALTRGLEALVPGSVAIGEEACHADPSLLEQLAGAELVWVIDPLDGTSNFARGRGPFGLMVALLERGHALGGWIHLPATGRMASAVRGSGAFLDGNRVHLPPVLPDDERMYGVLLTGYLPAEQRRRVESGTEGLLLSTSHRCAARHYVDCLAGREQFALYGRTLAWDHAAGALIVEEAGGAARRFDGRDYQPAAEEIGLLVASSDPVWRALQRRLLAVD